MAFEFAPIETGETALSELAVQLKEIFNANVFTEEYLRWLYVDNPRGAVVGLNAFEQGEWAGHYATIPLLANISGEPRKGVLSLNTATHKDYRGRGLFTQLAQNTYDLALEKGYDFVVGVANANSTPGFLKHLNFTLLGPLTARVGRFQYQKPADEEFDFSPQWDVESLVWRLTKPGQGYFKDNKGDVFVNAAKGIDAYLYSDASNRLPLPMKKKSPLMLWIGSEDAATGLKGISVGIPKSVRPSPLNLIFKPLNKEIAVEPSQQINFQLIDFDAY